MEILKTLWAGKFLPFFIVLATNVAAQFLYKSAVIIKLNNEDFRSFFKFIYSWQAISGMLMQAVGLALWFILIKRYGLIWTGLMTSLIPLGTLLIGYFVFGERMTNYSVIGAALIISGLFLINL